MNDSSRPAAIRRNDGLTALALAAGLAFGHIVAAMAEAGAGRAFALSAALVFTVAASAATICALLALAQGSAPRTGRPLPLRWVVAIGAGWVVALAPGLS